MQLIIKLKYLINAFTKLHNKVLEQSEKYYKGVVKNLNIINDSVEYGNKAIQITNNNLNKIGSTVKSIDVKRLSNLLCK